MNRNRSLLVLTVPALAGALAACGGAPTPVSAPIAPAADARAAATPPGATPAAPRPAPVADPGARVDADDQSGDGTTVVVREAVLAAGPGWVAVRLDDGDRLLGSAPVVPGTPGPVTVVLAEPVPAGDDDTDLEVVLHLDDGDGVFDELRDPRVLDTDDSDDTDDPGDDGDDDGDDRDDDVEDDDLDYRRT